MEKKLLRSQDNRIVAGVCGGLGEYFDIDPVIFRILAVLLLIVNGFGAILYIIGWIAIPDSKETKKDKAERNKVVEEDKKEPEPSSSYVLIAFFAILLGALLLINNFIDIFNFHKTWPVLLIFLGVVLLVRDSWREK